MGDEARILIVCTGNICRSPFIERLLQRQLDEHRARFAQRILVHSAGTGAVTGSAMDKRAAAQLVAHGGDPTGFRARDLTPDLIAESDLILTATRDHRGRVAVMYPKALRQVFTFCDFADLVGGATGSIPLSRKVTRGHGSARSPNRPQRDVDSTHRWSSGRPTSSTRSGARTTCSSPWHNRPLGQCLQSFERSARAG